MNIGVGVFKTYEFVHKQFFSVTVLCVLMNHEVTFICQK